jgi:CRP-like cAMP-binding protein
VFLPQCDEEDWRRILRYCDRRRFRAGEDVVRSGDVDRSLLILESGVLDLVIAGEHGGERVLHAIEAPSVVGEVAFFDGGPRSGTLRAQTDGDLFRLGFAAFEALSAEMPALARAILLDSGRMLALRLRRATRAM